HEHEMIQQLTRSSEKMDKIMNLVNQGIVVIDENGSIQETNIKAELFLGMEEEKVFSSDVEAFLMEMIQGSDDSGRTISFLIDDEEKSFFVNKQKLISIGERSEYLLTLQDVNEIQHLAEKTTENQRKPF